MNSVHLIGRLATDVDVKEVNGGSKVSSFILAVDRTQEEANFALPHTKIRGEVKVAVPRTAGWASGILKGCRYLDGRPLSACIAWEQAMQRGSVLGEVQE